MSDDTVGEGNGYLSGWDIAVVVGYFVLIMATSVYVKQHKQTHTHTPYDLNDSHVQLSYRRNICNIIFMNAQSMFGNKRNTVDSYFLAGRKMTWLFVKKKTFSRRLHLAVILIYS